MTCSFISKKGLKCKNNSIPESVYCHIKTHYLTTTDYRKAIEKIKKEWVDDTYPILLFSKHNVSKDGWCFYNSFGMALLNIYNKKTKNKKIIDFFEEECFKSFMQNKNWNDKLFKEILTYKLLVIAKKWLFEHLNDLHEETKETINDFINGQNDKNEITIEEYLSIENIENKENLESKKWAGLCEQYSLSKYFDTDLISFIPQRYSYSSIDKKYNIMVSQVVRKNITRYYLSFFFLNNSNNSNNSTVLSTLNSAKEHDDMKYFFESLSDNMKKTIKYDLNNTIFLLVFISPDSNNENIHPHYNYLLFNEEEYPL
jgi:hypothetical protein